MSAGLEPVWWSPEELEVDFCGALKFYGEPHSQFLSSTRSQKFWINCFFSVRMAKSNILDYVIDIKVCTVSRTDGA